MVRCACLLCSIQMSTGLAGAINGQCFQLSVGSDRLPHVTYFFMSACAAEGVVSTCAAERVVSTCAAESVVSAHQPLLRQGSS
jgi:hypothetical protein